MSQAEQRRSFARFAELLASLPHEAPPAVRFSEASRRMLGGDGVAVTLNVLESSRLVTHASDELAATLDDLQDVAGEGPTIDAARDGEVVVGLFGREPAERWSMLREQLASTGFHGSLVAVPLLPAVAPAGVLTVHRSEPPDENTVADAGLLGAAVGAALLEHSVAYADEEVTGEGGSRRAVVHQATGMIVVQAAVGPQDALVLLRSHAYALGRSLYDTAVDVVERRVDFGQLMIEGDP